MARVDHLFRLLCLAALQAASAFAPGALAIRSYFLVGHCRSVCGPMESLCTHKRLNKPARGITPFALEMAASNDAGEWKRSPVSRPFIIRVMEGGSRFAGRGLRTLVYAVVRATLRPILHSKVEIQILHPPKRPMEAS